MEHTTIKIQVNYDGCTSKQDRAQVRVQAKRKARRQLDSHDHLLDLCRGAFESIGVYAKDYNFTPGRVYDELEAAIATKV